MRRNASDSNNFNNRFEEKYVFNLVFSCQAFSQKCHLTEFNTPWIVFHHDSWLILFFDLFERQE